MGPGGTGTWDHSFDIKENKKFAWKPALKVKDNILQYICLLRTIIQMVTEKSILKATKNIVNGFKLLRPSSWFWKVYL